MDVLRTAISYIGQADESNKLDAASKVTAISLFRYCFLRQRAIRRELDQ